MKSANQWPWKPVVLWLRIVFGAHLVYSGLAFVITSWTPADMVVIKPGVGTFMVAMEQIGLYQVVKYLEVATGAMLLLDIATPLALVLEFPITIVIVYLCLVVNPVQRQLYTGPQELFLNVSLLIAYGGYYRSFLHLRAPPAWLWSETSARPAREARAMAGWVIVLAVTLGLSAIALIASAVLSEAGRQLVARDYVPLLCAFAAMGFSILRQRPKTDVGVSAPGRLS